MSKVVSTNKLNEHYTAYEIEVPEIAARVEPGQLLEVRVGSASLAPQAVADFDREKGTVTVVVADAPGDNGGESPAIDLGDLVGRHHKQSGFSKILCAAEGVGVAGLRPRLEELKANDVYTVVVAGYRTKAHVYWTDRMDAIADELYIVTEDGSYGIKGPVRDVVRGICETEPDIERALFIGSVPLLRTCCKITEKFGIPTLVSVNAALVEDTGAPAEGTARTAANFDWRASADLDGHNVDFDELAQKLGITVTR